MCPLRSPLPLSYILPNLSVCVTFHSILLSISLQEFGFTALMRASHLCRTEAVKALMTAPDIDVNHADVSLYPLTPSHLQVGDASTYISLLYFLYLPHFPSRPFYLLPPSPLPTSNSIYICNSSSFRLPSFVFPTGAGRHSLDQGVI